MTAVRYPEGFTELLAFLCRKYKIDQCRVFAAYDSTPPPPLTGNVPGYYDGLLSYRERAGNPEFLITVYTIARDPLLTLAHEFAHLVDDLRRGKVGQPLRQPDESREREFDAWARRDLAEFSAQQSS